MFSFGEVGNGRLRCSAALILLCVVEPLYYTGPISWTVARCALIAEGKLESGPGHTVSDCPHYLELRLVRSSDGGRPGG